MMSACGSNRLTIFSLAGDRLAMKNATLGLRDDPLDQRTIVPELGLPQRGGHRIRRSPELRGGQIGVGQGRAKPFVTRSPASRHPDVDDVDVVADRFGAAQTSSCFSFLSFEPLAKPLFPGIKTESDALRIRIGARTSLNFATASYGWAFAVADPCDKDGRVTVIHLGDQHLIPGDI